MRAETCPICNEPLSSLLDRRRHRSSLLATQHGHENLKPRLALFFCHHIYHEECLAENIEQRNRLQRNVFDDLQDANGAHIHQRLQSSWYCIICHRSRLFQDKEEYK